MENKISLNSKVSLTEIILSILIFVISGVIILNCFGIARFTQLMATDKTKAGVIVQSDFEIIKSFKTVDEMHEFLIVSYNQENTNNSSLYTKRYGGKTNKEYIATVIISEEKLLSGTLVNIDIKAEKESNYPFIKKEDTKQIYTLSTKKFFPNFGGGHEK